MGDSIRSFSYVRKAYARDSLYHAFGKTDWANEIAAAGGPISICFTAGLDVTNGYQSIDLHLVDWQPAAALQPAMST